MSNHSGQQSGAALGFEAATIEEVERVPARSLDRVKLQVVGRVKSVDSMGSRMTLCSPLDGDRTLLVDTEALGSVDPCSALVQVFGKVASLDGQPPTLRAVLLVDVDAMDYRLYQSTMTMRRAFLAKCGLATPAQHIFTG